ncbi:MAG: 23S rRNA (pseudouridine(1915)-N(3))-methyltransferase RlmH [Lachnospiraceae bacterium]|nr:23S rRNA (pseudouridine(1915)-N(3))-methyltransferase RlmH [Lachnospiraceae bacterium]
MNINIVCAGKLKEAYLRDAAAEYVKRLSRYCRIRITEVEDGPDMHAEAERILKKLNPSSYIITLEIMGTEVSSEELSDKLKKLGVNGISDITFIIGGSDGLDNRIISLAREHISFSRLTFTHQIMRVLLLEQIYRSFKIMSGEPYHK